MNHQEELEKWLWRALWDIYIACDINGRSSLKRLQVKDPEPSLVAEAELQSQSACRDRNLSLIQELALERPRAVPPSVAPFGVANNHGGSFLRQIQRFVSAGSY